MDNIVIYLPGFPEFDRQSVHSLIGVSRLGRPAPLPLAISFPPPSLPLLLIYFLILRFSFLSFFLL